MEREVEGGIGMGNTFISMADSFQCMPKPTTIKKKKKRKKEKGICLPMQQTRVQPLIQEDYTFCGASKPMCHNC